MTSSTLTFLEKGPKNLHFHAHILFFTPPPEPQQEQVENTVKQGEKI